MINQCGGIINRNFQVTARAYTRLTEPVVSLLARRQVTFRANFNLIHLQLNKQKIYWFKFKQMKMKKYYKFSESNQELTSCSHIFTITLAVAVSL